MASVSLPVRIPSSAPALSASPVLASWSRAIDLFNSKLTRDEKKKIDLDNCPTASFSDILAAAQDARAKVEGGRYRCTRTVQEIITLVNRYAVAGDLVVQHHAEYTSLVWGAFRFLLMVSILLSSVIDVVELICTVCC